MHRSRLGKVCAALAILLAFISVGGSRAGAQMAEVLPGAESSASSSAEPSGSGGAADAAANCCPPLPAPQPMGSQRRQTPPDRNADAQASAATGSDSSRPSAADRPSVRKAPWFLEEDPALPMVGGSGTGGSDSGNQNPLFPPPTALPEPLDPVNRFVVAQWQRESAGGARTREVCLDSGFRLYQWADAAPDYRIQPLNRKLFDHFEKAQELEKQYKSPWPLELTEEEKAVAKALAQGDLSAVDPNFQETSNPQQSGDIVFFPGYTVRHGDYLEYVPGHLGIVLFNAKKNRWEFASTNNRNAKGVIPGWTVEPLERRAVDYFGESNQLLRFFHWIGPASPAAGP